jgi:hypothetical protein
MVDFKYDEWNKWTSKSQNIPFDHKEQGTGDGEFKLGAEFGLRPQGQNVKHDLLINGEKWEVKKLDLDGSFRLGVDAQIGYLPVQMNLLQIFIGVDEALSLLQDVEDDEIKLQLKKAFGKINTGFGRSRTKIIDGLIKSEVCEANLNMIDSILDDLRQLIEMPESMDLLRLRDPKGAEKEVYPDQYYKIYKAFGVSEEFLKRELENAYSFAVTKFVLKDLLDKFGEESFKDILNKIVRDLFDDMILVLVNKTRGYKPLTSTENIRCYRITHGNPRCKYDDD